MTRNRLVEEEEEINAQPLLAFRGADPHEWQPVVVGGSTMN